MDLINKARLTQLENKINIMKSFKVSGEEIEKSFSKDELDLIEKGTKANIGEIRNWGGKKYKKQPNGKWLEVSEHGMTKKEHKDKISEHKSKIDKLEESNQHDKAEFHFKEAKKHTSEFAKLSDKEHSDEEVGLVKEGDKIKNIEKDGKLVRVHYENGETSVWEADSDKGEELLKEKEKSEKKEGKPKYHQINYNGVREWSGDDITDKDINDVIDSLREEADITFSEMEVESEGSQEMFQDAVQEKVNELYGEVREGMWPSGMKKNKIRDILWGVIMDRSLGKNKSLDTDIEKSEDSKEKKVAKVMREFKNGTLKDSHGNVVTDLDQAIAIAMSEAGLSKD